jgi:hypothetical protein
MEYCIQCIDTQTGKRGDFLHVGNFRAISPVFDNLPDLFFWMEKHGYKRKSEKYLASLEVVWEDGQ